MQDALRKNKEKKKNPAVIYPGENCVTYLNNFGLGAGFFVNFVPSKIFPFQIRKMDFTRFVMDLQRIPIFWFPFNHVIKNRPFVSSSLHAEPHVSNSHCHQQQRTWPMMMKFSWVQLRIGRERAAVSPLPVGDCLSGAGWGHPAADQC